MIVPSACAGLDSQWRNKGADWTQVHGPTSRDHLQKSENHFLVWRKIRNFLLQERWKPTATLLCFNSTLSNSNPEAAKPYIVNIYATRSGAMRREY